MSRFCKDFGLFLIFTTILFIHIDPAPAAHGISIDGKMKYEKDFSHFSYVNPNAPRGGKLTLHSLGSFDKMNPYTLKGSAADGLKELIFETLAVGSLDEPFAAYGLIARNIIIAPDRQSITLHLNPAARFSDGSNITSEDVKFSLETLKSDKSHPFYAAYYQDIDRAEIIDSLTVRFHFTRANREIHMIAAQLPVLSRSFYQKHPFNGPEMIAPIGSGPYLVKDYKQGKYITYERNPDYWGHDLNCRKGMHNFNTITFKYFKDQIVSVEAFKAREFDFMSINIAKQWARDLKGSRFDQGLIIKKPFPHHNNAGMQAFVMNNRSPLFKNRLVRQALALAFDFARTNKTLFFDQYTQTNSYFSNSYLAATGLPTPAELQLLEPLQQIIPAAVFTTELKPVKTDSPAALRANLRHARSLLNQAGWQVRDGILQDKNNHKFTFEILLVSPSFERVMADYVRNLKILGIKASYRTIDPALYIRRMQNFDFDMTVDVFGQSQSPGNEQRDMWSSAAADRPGSRNSIGIKDPAVDQLVDHIIYAKNQDDLITACRALDRVLWHNHYVVPNWYLNRHRLTYWNVFGQPENLPLYYSPMDLLMTWWHMEVN